MALHTRQPTGKVAFPTLIVEGESKSGRSFASYRLAADERVGRTFVFELGESRADEYATLGPFEIVEHDGTYTGIAAQVAEATQVPHEDGRPNVIIIDTASALWGMLKDWASMRARSSRRAKSILEKDPDADIDVSSNYWNDAKDRWWGVINMLKAWDGIAILVAQAENKTKFENGQPTKEMAWTRELEKGTIFRATAVVRTRYPNPPTVTDVNSLRVELDGRGEMALPADGGLGHFIFDVLGGGGGFVPERLNLVDGTALPRTAAKTAAITRVENVIFAHESATLDQWTPTRLTGRAWEAAGFPDDKQEWSTADLDRLTELAARLLDDDIAAGVVGDLHRASEEEDTETAA